MREVTNVFVCILTEHKAISKHKNPTRIYLLPNIIKGCWKDHGEADEKYICARIPEGPQTIILFLASGVKELQEKWIASNKNSHSVVVKNLRG